MTPVSLPRGEPPDLMTASSRPCRVLHMTVCLSDSQLHLFMQTQLPVRHIEDCVQGHTPYTVTDAILTYASSNRGFAQAQEEDLQKERGSSVVSYESMERSERAVKRSADVF